MIGCHRAARNLTGFTINRAPNDGPRVHIQTNTCPVSYHWGLHICGIDQGHPVDNPRLHVSEAPATNPHTVYPNP